ncbi:MAG TPA: alpha/beta hydrolase-fold protein [Streptosporangiaceae bacterium]|nr:alpha/beta hydrolase-fold protein [Streptosporangiaceae bacterium]
MSIRTDSTSRPDTIQPDTSQQAASRSGPRLRPHFRIPRWLLAVVTAAAAAVGATVLALTVNWSNVSIVGGWFPTLLAWVTIAVCVIAVVLRRDVLKEFAFGIPAGLVLIGVLFAGLHLTRAIPTGAPRSMYVWLCLTCLVAGLVLAGWRRAHWPRRICGIVAVVLTVVSAGSAVNQTFAYYPTFDRLFGKTANHFLDDAQLSAMRTQVDKTGQLPDHGATLSVPIPGTNLKFTPRQAYVWVPPAWFARNRPQLPVIELLHGTPGDPSNWTKSSYADATALAFAEQHHGVAPILVMPDVNGSWGGDTECVNSTMYGDVETYLTKTVPAYMRKNFNASTAAGSIAIAGLSEGGLCATTLALNNPKEYAAFGDYSGDESPTYQSDNQQQTIQTLFGGSTASYNAHNPPYILAQQRFTGLSGWFEAGAQDPVAVKAAHALQPLAAGAGIGTCLATPSGGHDFTFWQQSFSDSLPWLSWKLKLTPQPKSVPAQCVPGRS